MIDFKKMKEARGAVERLTQAVQKTASSKRDDERFWEPTVDKAGNGHAIIRFLPAPPQDGEDGLPWVRTFSHGFQGPGGWFIDNCPTTIEQPCPVCEGNTTLWNSGIEANKAVARERKRKLSYVANILVVADPAKPENDGKVRLFKFGKKVFDKIYEKMHPEFPDEKAFSPFDLWEGANFKLKIRKVEGYRNYDKSEFAAQTPIADTDEKLEAIWKQESSLREFTDKKNFKTYAQLEARRVKVLGTSPQVATAESTPGTAESDSDPANPVSRESLPTDAGGDDEDMAFFKNLADGQ